MKQRINVYDKGTQAMKTLYRVGLATSGSTVEQTIFDLIFYRVSQMNGCAYCLATDAEKLQAKGETPQRILLLNAWRDTSLYNARERAALSWAEAVTRVHQGVSDQVYAEVKAHFTDQELIDLTMCVVTINAYNRVNISFRVTAGAHETAFAV